MSLICTVQMDHDSDNFTGTDGVAVPGGGVGMHIPQVKRRHRLRRRPSWRSVRPFPVVDVHNRSFPRVRVQLVQDRRAATGYLVLLVVQPGYFYRVLYPLGYLVCVARKK